MKYGHGAALDDLIGTRNSAWAKCRLESEKSAPGKQLEDTMTDGGYILDMVEESIELARSASDWLVFLGYTAKPISVLIESPGGKNSISLVGAKYWAREGDHWEGCRLYLLVDYTVLKRLYSKKHYYSIAGQDWYIAGYSDKKSMRPQYEQYHPLGSSVIMAKWDCDMPLDSRWIGDREEVMPQGHYPRLPIRVTEIPE